MFRRRASDFEEVQKVIVLTMGVSTDDESTIAGRRRRRGRRKGEAEKSRERLEVCDCSLENLFTIETKR